MHGSHDNARSTLDPVHQQRAATDPMPAERKKKKAAVSWTRPFFLSPLRARERAQKTRIGVKVRTADARGTRVATPTPIIDL